jgi:hypothetical protein
LSTTPSPISFFEQISFDISVILRITKNFVSWSLIFKDIEIFYSNRGRGSVSNPQC